eukprot:CAMPEP_0194342984 /NCGR_PEP_ID=MMETSP0171-20130528/94672_1 /TAXON_ID=218684 /ORGANISM="Corethron pennatum, Strain L29A3" /LENGTH=76 /DNA_ID=CAMNT_0039108943 /DNA_START=16 /DNA_END=242 /DNA_ORIENTATION=+
MTNSQEKSNGYKIPRKKKPVPLADCTTLLNQSLHGLTLDSSGGTRGRGTGRGKGHVPRSRARGQTGGGTSDPPVRG